MPLLPRSRIFATGGQLAADPNDPTLPTTEPARSQELARRQNAQQAGAGAGAGSQVAGTIQQAGQLAGSFGGPGLAGVASAAGPISLAIGAGAALGGALRSGNTEADGLRATTTGGQVKDALANTLDPIGNAVSTWKNDQLSVGEKVLSTLAPGLGSLFTKKLVDKQREEQTQQRQRAAGEQAAAQTRSVYGGLGSQFSQFSRGGLLPRRFADGGRGPGQPAAPPVESVRYTVKNPSPEAQQYYQSALPTMKKLIGQKHDEVYTDPQSGRQCTANSCLSFATTILEQATGRQQARTKQNLYNPEFTRTSEQQGWTRIPLADAQAGDRLQYWQSRDQFVQPQDSEADRQLLRGDADMRIADLGNRQYIAGKYPRHMMVLSAPLRSQGEKKPYYGEIVQDGHEFTAADRGDLSDIDDKSYVAYRYYGGTTQPAATAARPVASRAQGGLLPGQPGQLSRPTQAARQDATAPGNRYRGNSATGDQQPSQGWVGVLRASLPLNAAMFVQDMTGNKTPLTEQDVSEAELQALRTAARRSNGREISSTGREYGGAGTSLMTKLTKPGARMQTTIGGATLHQRGARTHLTDSFDFNRSGDNDKVLAANLLAQPTLYKKLRYLGGKLGSKEGEGIPVSLDLGNLKRPRPGEFKRGGLLPGAQKSVIATGALHSEVSTHHRAGHPTAGKRGIPVLAADGTKLAEVERDELTLTDTATEELERLRASGDLLGMGRHLQRELLTNTISSPRYQKRLAPTK